MCICVHWSALPTSIYNKTGHSIASKAVQLYRNFSGSFGFCSTPSSIPFSFHSLPLALMSSLLLLALSLFEAIDTVALCVCVCVMCLFFPFLSLCWQCQPLKELTQIAANIVCDDWWLRLHTALRFFYCCVCTKGSVVHSAVFSSCFSLAFQPSLSVFDRSFAAAAYEYSQAGWLTVCWLPSRKWMNEGIEWWIGWEGLMCCWWSSVAVSMIEPNPKCETRSAEEVSGREFAADAASANFVCIIFCPYFCGK